MQNEDTPADVALLASGPWPPDGVTATWSACDYRASVDLTERADRAVATHRAHGAAITDGPAARLVSHQATQDGLHLELQPTRWALALVDDPALRTLSVLCLVRDVDGRWLAGRRAGWSATWPGRWTLGAAGAVEAGEQPSAAMCRELREEWDIRPDSLVVHALIQRSPGRVFLVGLAQLKAGTQIEPNAEHDAFAWWPADPLDWPTRTSSLLRRFAALCLPHRP